MDGLAESIVCALHPDFSSPAFQYGGSVVMASLDELPQLASGTIDIDGRKDWVRDQLDTGGCDIWMHASQRRPHEQLPCKRRTRA